MLSLKILAVSGSLRAESYNTKVLLEFARLALGRAEVEFCSLAEIPLYNEDVDGAGLPAVVTLKHAIERADGLVIATPEYNYGVPGVLKNAIDWVSRPAYNSVLTGKPVAILGASQGQVGTARAQGQLKQVLLGTVCEVFPSPEIAIGDVATKFDDTGTLKDERTLHSLERFISGYCNWLSRYR